MVGFDGNRRSPYSHMTHILSNFSVQYSFTSMSIAFIVMSVTVCTRSRESCKDGIQDDWVIGTSNAASLIGAIVGQLTMGGLGDLLGRSTAYLITMLLATFGTFMSAVAPPSSGDPSTIYGIIVTFRFFMGIGLGGVFPLAATKSAEDGGSSDGKSVDSTNSASAFFWQSPGAIAPWLIAYILTFDDDLSADVKWRTILGLGAIPSGIACILLFLENRYLESHKPLELTKDNVTILKRSLRIKNKLEFKTGARTSDNMITVDENGELDHEQGIDDNEEFDLEESATINKNRKYTQTTDMNSSRHATMHSSSHKRETLQNDGSGKNNDTHTSISSLTDSVNTEVGLPNSPGYRIGSIRGSSMIEHTVARTSMTREYNSIFEAIRAERQTDKHIFNKFMVTGVCWMMYDICIYGITLFAPEIIHAIVPSSSNVSDPIAVRNLTSKTMIALALGIFGTGISVHFLNYLPLKMMQMTGFGCICLICIITASVYNDLIHSDPTALYGLFCLIGFFLNLFVNITTFVLPAAVFRKEARSTFNGAAAAIGKCGAVIGAYAFPALYQYAGQTGVVMIFVMSGICSAIGVIITYFFLVDGMVKVEPTLLQRKRSVDKAQQKMDVIQEGEERTTSAYIDVRERKDTIPEQQQHSVSNIEITQTSNPLQSQI